MKHKTKGGKAAASTPAPARSAARDEIEGKATPGDLRVLDEVLAAARSPCPTVDSAWNADVNPWLYDELIHVLERADVRAVFLRLLPPLQAQAWPWWTICELDVPAGIRSYVASRAKFIEGAQDLHRRIVEIAKRLKWPTDPASAMPALGIAERQTVKTLRAGPRTSAALSKLGSTKRARERLVLEGMIEACGSGKKSKRGVYMLTEKGRLLADRIDAGE